MSARYKVIRRHKLAAPPEAKPGRWAWWHEELTPEEYFAVFLRTLLITVIFAASAYVVGLLVAAETTHAVIAWVTKPSSGRRGGGGVYILVLAFGLPALGIAYLSVQFARYRRLRK